MRLPLLFATYPASCIMMSVPAVCTSVSIALSSMVGDGGRGAAIVSQDARLPDVSSAISARRSAT